MHHKFAQFYDAKRIRLISLLTLSRKKENWYSFKKIWLKSYLIQKTNAYWRKWGIKHVIHGNHPLIIWIGGGETTNEPKPKMNQGKCKIFVKEIIQEFAHSVTLIKTEWSCDSYPDVHYCSYILEPFYKMPVITPSSVNKKQSLKIFKLGF